MTGRRPEGVRVRGAYRAVMSLVTTAAQRLLAVNEARIDRVRPKVDGPLDTADVPWAAPLEAHWRDLRAEVEALERAEVQIPSTTELAGVDQGADGRWLSYVLYSYGTWLEFNAKRCPRTTELVRGIPGLQIAGFSVLGPRSHLPRHRGPNRGALRYQVGLKVPGRPGDARIQVGDVVHEWSEGVSMVFDHAVHHEAWNDSDGYRYVLFIEYVWPLPGLTGVLNQATQRFFSLAARGLPDRAMTFEAEHNQPGTAPRPG